MAVYGQFLLTVDTRLARGLAAATGKDLVILQWPAWRIAGGALRASALERRLHGPCLVVDDIWTDGATMTAIARLARASGADRVYGLAATMSHRDEDGV